MATKTKGKKAQNNRELTRTKVVPKNNQIEEIGDEIKNQSNSINKDNTIHNKPDEYIKVKIVPKNTRTRKGQPINTNKRNKISDKNKPEQLNNTEQPKKQERQLNSIEKNKLYEILVKKKMLLIENLRNEINIALSSIPEDLYNLPLLTVQDTLSKNQSSKEICIQDKTKKIKNDAKVSLKFGDEYFYDGKKFVDAQGKNKNKTLDQNPKNLLKNAKKIADQLGKDMSLFIE